MALKPQTSSKGISSQDNGDQELQGSYVSRPMPGNIGKNASVVVNPLMGSTGGASKLGNLNGRKTK